MAKAILILGASMVGLKVAHKLLKRTLNNTDEYKVLLVDPTTHHFWNLASVRAIIPGIIPDEKIFSDILSGFKQYPVSKFTFIHGSATALDVSKKIVTISKSGSKETLSQEYDILVICTGSRYSGDDAPWKSSLEGYEATKDRLHAVQKKVGEAKSIVIGGGGATGVETAGELGFEYGKTKEITLITAGKKLITPDMLESVQDFSLNELKKLNVTVQFETKILESKKVNGKYELALSNGEKKVVDLYLPTGGVTLNTSFVPERFKNQKGEVVVDEYFKVKGAEDVWAAGDACDVEPPQAVFAGTQAVHLAKNLDLLIKGGPPLAYTIKGPMLGLALGRSRGTGRSGNSKAPSLVIWWMKCRTMMMENQPGLVLGSSA